MNTGIQVDIDGEQINQYVADAVMKSVIGEEIKRCIENQFKDWSFRQVIAELVKAKISELVWMILQNEYQDKLKEAIREKISEDIVSDLVQNSFDQWINNRK